MSMPRPGTRSATGLAVAAAAVTAVVAGAAAPASGTTVTSRVVEAPGGVDPDVGAVDPEVTPDGRYLVFRSRSSNLIPVTELGSLAIPEILNPSVLQPPGEDLDYIGVNVDDVYVLDLSTGTYELASLNSAGVAGSFDSGGGVATPDGRYVVFHSLSNDLTPVTTFVPGRQIFRKDRLTGQTVLVSQSTAGVRGQGGSAYTPAVSDDGNVVVWNSSAGDLVTGDANGTEDVFLRDVAAGTTVRLSQPTGGGDADGASTSPLVTADGTAVFFTSTASNLVAGDTNGVSDAFVLDRSSGLLSRLPLGVGGAQPDKGVFLSAISPDGRFVTVESAATNLDPAAGGITTSQVFVHDRVLGRTTLASGGAGGALPSSSAGSADISDDGRYVAFQSGSTNLVAGDTNARDDVFVRDLRTGSTSRVSVNPDGSQRLGTSWNPTMTADGTQVFYIFQAVGSGRFDIYRATTDPEGPVVVLPEPEFVGLMTAIAGAVPELQVAGRTATTFTVGTCTSPLPSSSADYLAALSGSPYQAGGVTAPALGGACAPDAVTTAVRTP